MYIRLATEFGLIGLLILLLTFTLKRKVGISLREIQIAKASLLFIFTYCIRSGQIVRFDFMFFCGLIVLIFLANSSEHPFKTSTSQPIGKK
jgi:hypothetical protein